MAYLPTETMAEIALEVATSNRGNLRRCTMVSKRFRDIFEPLMYRRITLTDGVVKEGDTDVAAWGVPRPALLLEVLSRRPDLGNNVKILCLGISAGWTYGKDVLTNILKLTPNLTRFDFRAGEGVAYEALNPEMKRAIVTTCQKPSLRELSFYGFQALPSSLLCVNPQLTHLLASNVWVFTECEPTFSMVDNLRNGDPDVPPNHFAGLRMIQRCLMPMLARSRWLNTAIQSSCASGSLHTLSLIVPVMAPGPDSSNTETALFGQPLDFVGTSSLTLFRIKGCVMSIPYLALGPAKVVFRDFCQFIRLSLMSINISGTLRHVALLLDLKCDHRLLALADFWDIPAWNQLCDVVGHTQRRHHLNLRTVSLQFMFGLPADLMSKDHSSCVSNIQQHVSRLAPDIDCKVSFYHLQPSSPAN